MIPRPFFAIGLFLALPVLPLEAVPSAPYLVQNLNQTLLSDAGSFPIPLGYAGGQAVFAVASGELWASDGTTEGTHLLRGAILNRERTKVGGVSEQVLVETAGKLFLIEAAGGSRRLWVTDGTAAGTMPLTSGVFLFDPRTDPNEYYWSDRRPPPAACPAAPTRSLFPGSCRPSRNAVGPGQDAGRLAWTAGWLKQTVSRRTGTQAGCDKTSSSVRPLSGSPDKLPAGQAGQPAGRLRRAAGERKSQQAAPDSRQSATDSQQFGRTASRRRQTCSGRGQTASSLAKLPAAGDGQPAG